ncbi:protein adenylyltransferase SelO [Neiella holothuriorum]|uniref:protein adenylyltransferase SelO n=1 Tax=Neiella holothuriorum TaxID=2870530 RepID=UPI00299055D1|nr:YdiU family protein [Neiella holothuriorum]
MENWQFDNRWYRQLKGSYSEVAPSAVDNPRLVAYSSATATLLDLPKQADEDALCRYFSGQQALPGAQPLAQVYAGHQFGQYVPQLGDGRGLLLGQICTQQAQLWDLHLKGAGQTPYSRFGDGRAVLRSSIREFLASEALQALGIPTTRALCVIGSDTPVRRETMESAATLLRVAESHLRFGHFEYFFHRNEHEKLKALADYALEHHFAECTDSEAPYLDMFIQVVERTAQLIAQWQAVGFTHGVMNTDNMSLLGLTIDYGPYGFMDGYNAGYVPNHSDHGGRYSYAQQPSIGYWNLQCLALALSPLLTKAQSEQALARYEPALLGRYSQLMAAKFGLAEIQQNDGEMLNGLFTLMQAEGQDFTRTLRQLSQQRVDDARTPMEDDWVDRDGFRAWWQAYRQRRLAQGDSDHWQQHMLMTNPNYVLRNYLAQQVIEQAEQGDYSGIAQLQKVLHQPFAELAEFEQYAALPPDWSKQLEISCSS